MGTVPDDVRPNIATPIPDSGSTGLDRSQSEDVRCVTIRFSSAGNFSGGKS